MLRVVIILLIFLIGNKVAATNLENDAHAYTLLKKASAELRARLYADALHTLEETQKLEGVTDITRTQIAAAMTRAAIGMGDYAKAWDNYHIARIYSPDDETDDMLRLIGSELLFAVGDYDRALALTDSVTTPRYAATASSHKVRALTMLSRYNDAIALAEKAIQQQGDADDDTKAILLQNRGYARWEANDLNNAAADLLSAIGMISDDTDRLNLLGNLAIVESELGNHKDALNHINEAVNGLPASTSDGRIARRKRAEILRRAGLTTEASKAFRDFFKNEKTSLIANLPDMSPAERLNYWEKVKLPLSRCFDANTDAELLYDVAIFRRLTSLLGMRDNTEITSLLHIKSKEIRKSLHKGEAALEIVTYAPSKGQQAYAALVLPRDGKASFVPLLDEDELYAPETIGNNSIYNALRRESPREKNILYSDSSLAERIWRPIIDALPHGTTELYFAPEGVFHWWAIENMPFSGREKFRLHRVTSTASLINRSCSNASQGNTLIVGGLDYNRHENVAEKGSCNSEASETLKSRGGIARFSYLKGTEAEADSIGCILPWADVAHTMGEAHLKSIMPSYNMVHVATHGYTFNFGIKKRPEFLADSIAIDRSLLGSGLALSGANSGYNPTIGEDELLSAKEICEMDLSGVDFVILSACRTALGTINDEGAPGLVRGLKMAGVKTIMATLWEVDDMSTMLFMQAFHKALAEGNDKHTAYLSAQSRVRDIPTQISYRPFSARIMAREQTTRIREIPPFDEPYYWAPFILIDDF